MRLLRRLTAAFSSILLLQLTLLGGGTPCAMHGEGAVAGPMPAHAMEGMQGTARAVLDSGDGCRLPSAPGQCAAMTSCAPAAVPSHVVVAQLTTSHGDLDLPEPASIRSGPAAAPELPPPRA
jgi:hypothetical protein